MKSVFALSFAAVVWSDDHSGRIGIRCSIKDAKGM
jgi:hypothetical protein